MLVPLHLYVYIPAAHVQISIHLRSSTSPSLQHASQAPDLHTSKPPPRPPARSMPHKFQTSMHRHLHVPKPTARLPSSRSLEANTSTSPDPQHASRPPYLYTFTSSRPQYAS